MQFSEITIDDKELFDKYLKVDEPQASDISFTNLFMWRNYYKFRYAVAADLICLIAVPERGEPFALAPIGNVQQGNFREAFEYIREYFVKNGWRLIFKKVEENKLQYFGEFVKAEDDIVFDRDNSDYVYLSTDLTFLKGKKFDGKRNHINKFKKLYQYEYVQLTEEHMDACYSIMDQWCEERNCGENKEFYHEKLANTELLKHMDKLQCKGALIKVDGKFEGFTVGEMLNRDTAVIHIEKANSAVNGLYTFLNQQFCEHEWQSATYINREQDLGSEGLRKAKLSYNPVKIINKYTVKL